MIVWISYRFFSEEASDGQPEITENENNILMMKNSERRSLVVMEARSRYSSLYYQTKANINWNKSQFTDLTLYSDNY